MKNKKGFTLVELLAVIVILAILATVAIPVVLNMIERAKKSSARSSALGYIDAIEYSQGLSEYDVNYVKLEDGIYDTIDIENLKLKGKSPLYGEVEIEHSRVKEAGMCINGYYAVYENKDVEVIEKCSEEEDKTAPVIIIDKTSSDTKSITIEFRVIEEESSIKKTTCKINNEEVEINNGKCSKSGLKNNTEYAYEITSKNKQNKVSTRRGVVTTGDFESIGIQESPAAGVYTLKRTLTLAGSSEGTELEYKIGQGEWSKYTTPIEITANGTSVYVR